MSRSGSKGAEVLPDDLAGLVDSRLVETPRLVHHVVPSCGHYPAEEAPDALLAALLPFLAG